MLLGTNIMGFLKSGYTVPEALERVKAHGLTCVDFPGFRVNMPQSRPVHEQLYWAKLLERMDIDPFGCFYLPKNNPGSKKADVRMAALEEMKPSARMINNLGGKAIVFCEASGRAQYEEDLSKEEAFYNAVETVKRFCEWTYNEVNPNLKVLLEIAPYGGSLCSVEKLKEFCDLVDMPNCYINADLGHFNLQKVNGNRFKLAGDRMISVHMSDDDNHGDEGKIYERDCLIGQGTTDFKAYFKALKEMDIEGNARKAGLKDCYCMLETFILNNGIADYDTVITRAMDYIFETLPGVFDSSIRVPEL